MSSSPDDSVADTEQSQDLFAGYPNGYVNRETASQLLSSETYSIGKDGKLYYTNADGEKVEFEFNSEEYQSLKEKYGNVWVSSIYPSKEDLNEELKYKAMSRYFTDTLKNSYAKDLTELSGNNPVPTTVSQEEFNNITQKICNGIIPSDYEMAQFKVYVQNNSQMFNNTNPSPLDFV